MPASRSLIVWGVGIGAVMFWVLSQAGGPMGFADSFFQPHGLLWRPLAGVMAVLLYFIGMRKEPSPRVAVSPRVSVPCLGALVGRWSAATLAFISSWIGLK